MFRVFAICVVLLLPTSLLQAEDGEMGRDMPAPRGFVDLTNATVLGSPGVPGAMFSHLPGGKQPTPITWPLPDGPVLLLGLPAHDDTAFDVAEALGLLEDPDELAGGYRAWAWESDGRAIAVVLAADRSALFSARFLFEAAARPEALNPSMRTVNMKGGDGSASVWMRTGHESKEPASAVRAWVTGRRMTRADWFAAIGAHVNEVWITAGPTPIPWKPFAEALDMGVAIYRLDLKGSRATSVFLAPKRATDAFRTVGDPDAKTGLRPVFDGLGEPIGTLDARNDVRDSAFVPTRPTERANILQGGRYQLEGLAALWDVDAPVSDPASDMQRHFPIHESDPDKILAHAVQSMRAGPRQPWTSAVSKAIEQVRKQSPHLVPIVSSGVVVDGDATDRAWSYSTATEGKVRVRWVSDGTALFATCDGPYHVHLKALDREGDPIVWGALRRSGTRYEFAFAAKNLHGAAHAGRVLRYHIVGDSKDGQKPTELESGILVIVP